MKIFGASGRHALPEALQIAPYLLTFSEESRFPFAISNCQKPFPKSFASTPSAFGVPSAHQITRGPLSTISTANSSAVVETDFTATGDKYLSRAPMTAHPFWIGANNKRRSEESIKLNRIRFIQLLPLSFTPIKENQPLLRNLP